VPAGPSYAAASPCDVCIRGGGDGVRLLRLRGGPAGPRQRSAAAKGRGDGSVARTSGDL